MQLFIYVSLDDFPQALRPETTERSVRNQATTYTEYDSPARENIAFTIFFLFGPWRFLLYFFGDCRISK